MANRAWDVWYALVHNPIQVADNLAAGEWSPRLALAAGFAVDLALAVALIPLSLSATLIPAALVLELTFTAILSALACMGATEGLPEDYGSRYIFWFALFQVVLAPLIGLFVVLGSAMGLDPVGALEMFQASMICLMLGYALGVALSYRLAMRPRRLGEIDLRWGIALLSPAIAVGIWFSPALAGSLWILLTPALVGVALAQLRLVMWLWHGVWSWLMLRVGTRLQRLDWLLDHHPIQHDAIRLLPLPGTTELLYLAAERQPSYASAWILARSRHPSDRGAVLRFLRSYATHACAHRVFFALSLSREGGQLLAASAVGSGRGDMLNCWYARLSADRPPGAWLHELRRSGFALTTISPARVEITLRVLLPLAFEVLLARRWADAVPALREAALPGSREDPVLEALGELCALCLQALDPRDHEVLLQPILRFSAGDHGWPARLLIALADHLRFLKEAEALADAGEGF